MVHYRVIIVHVGRLPSSHVDLVPNGQSLPSRQEHGPNQGPMHPKVHHYHHVPSGVVPQPVSDIPRRRYLDIRRHGSHKWDQALILPTIPNVLVHIGSRDQYLDHGFSVSPHPLELNRLPKVRELHNDVPHHGKFVPMHFVHQRSARCIFLSVPIPNGTVTHVASDPRVPNGNQPGAFLEENTISVVHDHEHRLNLPYRESFERRNEELPRHLSVLHARDLLQEPDGLVTFHPVSSLASGLLQHTFLE